MKKIILLSLLFLISSCDLDKSIDNTEGQVDKDDINVIDKVGKQSLDKAIDMHYTRTHAS